MRLNGEPARTFTGSAAKLDGIVQQAAAAVFRRAQPYRYGVHLVQTRRVPEATALMEDLAQTGSPDDRVWAWSGLSLTLSGEGRFAEALEAARRAQALEPHRITAELSLAQTYVFTGHGEDDLREQKAVAEDAMGDSSVTPSLRPVIRDDARAMVAEAAGDYQAAIILLDGVAAMADYQGSVESAQFEAARDAALLHDAAQSRARLSRIDVARALRRDDGAAAEAAQARAYQALAAGDWRATIAAFEQDRTLTEKTGAIFGPEVNSAWIGRVLTGPWVGYADARLGDFAAAHAVIDRTPADCDLCLRLRADIDAAQKNWAGAEFWFARAVRAAPSFPFAETDWGRMLLQKGDYDGAIAKFESAHAKGPHFADPLELWGEALIAKNRSDLAPARFEDAASYAPNWGRLHLKWGEVLLWSGRMDAARMQFALAARLALSASEKSELARMRAA